MLQINNIHHIAIICSDYQKSKHFYTQILGFEIQNEVYRAERQSYKAERQSYKAERQSYKLDLSVNGLYQIELFSFPSPPTRTSRPEACGLRHLAFEVNSVTETRAKLVSQNIDCETIRIDEFTNKSFFFMEDPDGLPIEFYEK
jgi:glyoxylase I family protein